MRAFLLTVHIMAVIVAFGPTFAMALMGPMMSAGPERAAPLVELTGKISKIFIFPLATFVIPGAGVALIITQHWEPFGGDNWLLTAIILYVVMYAIGILVHRPDNERAVRLLDEGKYGSPEWVAVGKREQTAGMISTLLLTAIVTLMVWKPDF